METLDEDEFLIPFSTKTIYKWTPEATIKLIKYRFTYDHLFKSRGKSPSGWKTILKAMQSDIKKGNFSVATISKKWSDMYCLYKEYKKMLATNKISWPYFKVFDDFHSNSFLKVIDNKKSICRLCEEEEGVYSLRTDITLSKQIEKYLHLKVLEDSREISDLICIVCKIKIDCFHTFWLQCQEIKNKHCTQRKNNNLSTNTLLNVKIDTNNGKLGIDIVGANNDNIILTDKINKCIIKKVSNDNLIQTQISEEFVDNINMDSNIVEEVYDCKKEVLDLNNEQAEEQNSNDTNSAKPLTLEQIFNIDNEKIEQKDTEDPLALSGKEYNCQKCLKKCLSEEDVYKHIEKAHQQKCTVEGCNKVYSLKQSLRLHMLRDHEGKSLYLCTLCGKGCNTKSSLRIHEKQHAGIKDFSCELCDKKFYTGLSLELHLKRDHLNELLFCSKCTKSFRSESALRRHEIVHTGIRKYKCDICIRSFFTNRELTVHKKRHEGNKRHVCLVCLKTFFQKHHLLDHEKIHTGERPFSCLTCKKGFISKTKLKKHTKIHEN